MALLCRDYRFCPGFAPPGLRLSQVASVRCVLRCYTWPTARFTRFRSALPAQARCRPDLAQVAVCPGHGFAELRDDRTLPTLRSAIRQNPAQVATRHDLLGFARPCRHRPGVGLTSPRLRFAQVTGLPNCGMTAPSPRCDLRSGRTPPRLRPGTIYSVSLGPAGTGPVSA